MLIHYLDTYLNAQGIDIDYAFAIKETDKITGSTKAVKINQTGQPVDFKDTKYRAALFRDERMLAENSIELAFPDKQKHILSKSLPGMVLSGFFIMIVIWVFVMIIRNMMKQKKLSEMKNDFINNMTHELKTPISTIALASEGIRKHINGSNGKVTQFADIIYDENRRLSNQVEKILQISQIEKEELELDRSWFDLHEMINEVLAAHQVHIEEQKRTNRYGASSGFP